jgi:hypothetical protein
MRRLLKATVSVILCLVIWIGFARRAVRFAVQVWRRGEGKPA